ncbi:hypothetical protein ACWDRR_33680 [Kitasatospora sp. NPDC003701]
MTVSDPHAARPVPEPLPDPQTVLRRTDWPALQTAFGTGSTLPQVLTRLLGPDLTVEETGDALGALEPVRHQNTIYEATAPATLCVAAVLARRAEQYPGAADRACGLLPDWLADVARDSDDTCVEAGQRHSTEDHLEGYPAMAAVRALRPGLYQAVAPRTSTTPTRRSPTPRCPPPWRSPSTRTWPGTVTAWPSAPATSSYSPATRGGDAGRPLTP